MSCVTCQVSPVTCHVSPVTCQNLVLIFFIKNKQTKKPIYIYIYMNFFYPQKQIGQCGGASRWRVRYQQGLPRLVTNSTLYFLQGTTQESVPQVKLGQT